MTNSSEKRRRARILCAVDTEKYAQVLIGGREQKDELLRHYWSVSPRQMEVSVGLADETWYDLNSKG
jgi:hypothetical protein